MPDIPRSYRCSYCDTDWPPLYRAKPCPLCGDPLWPNDFEAISLTEARELERAHQAVVSNREKQIDAEVGRFASELENIEDELMKWTGAH